MTNEDRIEVLRTFVTSPLWLNIIEPMYRQRLANEVQALIDSGEDTHRGAIEVILWALGIGSPPPSSAKQRGKIRALQDLLMWPKAEVEQHELDKVRKQEQHSQQVRWDHYATWGRHSPVAPPDYPAIEGDN